MSRIAGYCNPRNDFTNDPKNNMHILRNMMKELSYKSNTTGDYVITKNTCMSYVEFENTTDNKLIQYNIEGNTYYIVFDGTIYNQEELCGDILKSHNITYDISTEEIIIRLYINYGINFINYLDGTFAIALYDEYNNSLFLIRDYFGIKPLYFTISNDTLLFASKIDALFEYPKIKPFIDMESFNEILTLGPSRKNGRAVFKNIYEVMPGEYLKISSKGIIKNSYFALQSTPHTDSLSDTIDKTKYLLENSIKKQTKTNSNLCSFLSGGIDSSYVSSICSQYIDKKLDTFSFDFIGNNVHFSSNSYQQSMDKPYIDIMTDYLDSNHTYLYCDSETLADFLYDSVDTRCLPNMADVDSSLLYFCGEVSRTHKCALTGECSDEIFGGYPWFHRKELLNSNTFPWINDLSFRKSLLNTEFVAALNMDKYIKKAYDNCINEVEILPYENDTDKKIRTITYSTIKYFMQTLIDRMDRNSSPYGLDARVPFADKELVSYVYNIPWNIKCLNNEPKGLLREIAKDSLPEDIIKRPKCPYPKTYNPEYENILKKRLLDIIYDNSSPIISYLNIDNLIKFIDEPMEYGKPWYGQLMAGPQMMAYLIEINYWMKKYSLSL